MDDLDLDLIIAKSKPAIDAVPASAELQKLQAAWTIDSQPAVAAMANDRNHSKYCKKSQCIRCNYVEHKNRLAKLTPLLAHFSPHFVDMISPGKMHASKGCWLSSAMVDGKWGAHKRLIIKFDIVTVKPNNLNYITTMLIFAPSGLGCIACCAGGGQGAFATFTWRGSGTTEFISSQRIQKHQQSQEHHRAVEKYFGIPGGGLASPSAEHMLDRFRLLQQGKVGNSSSKDSAMTWCLAEALLDKDRAFVRGAKSLALCRDDRHQRLLIRFTGANAQLETRSGVLGIGIDKGASADDIAMATKTVFEEFCTPRRNAPSHGQGPVGLKPDVDARLLSHLQDVCEVIVVDEEAAELKAADIGRGRRASATEMAPITPNLKFVARDKAHGYRRIV